MDNPVIENTYTCDKCGETITLQTEWPNQIDESVLENNSWSINHKNGERYCKNHTQS